jgi:hypothetical protein
MPPMDDKDIELLSNEIEMGFRAQSMGRDQNEVIDRMRGLTPELVNSYLSTDYLTTVSSKEVKLKIGELTPNCLNSYMETNRVNSWAIITAHNPYSVELSEEENIFRQSLLTKLVELNGYASQPAYGQSEDRLWTEPSIMIFGISYEMAQAMGICFQQNAIVFGETGYQVELVFCQKEQAEHTQHRTELNEKNDTVMRIRTPIRTEQGED